MNSEKVMKHKQKQSEGKLYAGPTSGLMVLIRRQYAGVSGTTEQS
jgi:hypothetical protein